MPPKEDGVSHVHRRIVHLEVEQVPDSPSSRDVAALVEFTGIFGPLRERAYFLQVRVNPDLGTICWPDGADLDQDVLYASITGQPIAVAEPALALAA